ncbi:dolichyl-P-Man:Man(5)GlcNAc(2)-PP-dolichol alpha-1,3-mannosyltransferase [Tulasnella sp. 403]|nr:dolichyl-P-Man:Man(5)GlcNAc(2)-PP-dolichol alpha-1,3-mannosyltransferase [Tulasnella sp. 403]
MVQSLGIISTVGHFVLMTTLQAAVAYPFLTTYPREYLRGAFDLSRVFLYKWTVNWRFLPEGVFLSDAFAKSLLLLHVTTLIIFGIAWCRPDGGVWLVLQRAFKRPSRPSTLTFVNTDRLTTVLFTSNLIGVVFARSLHYQFYSWYAQQLPLLLWRTKYPTLVKLGLLGAIEYAWNVYPSTTLSSGVFFSSNFVILLGVYFGYPTGRLERSVKTKQKLERWFAVYQGGKGIKRDGEVL